MRSGCATGLATCSVIAPPGAWWDPERRAARVVAADPGTVIEQLLAVLAIRDEVHAPALLLETALDVLTDGGVVFDYEDLHSSKVRGEAQGRLLGCVSCLTLYDQQYQVGRTHWTQDPLLSYRSLTRLFWLAMASLSLS